MRRKKPFWEQILHYFRRFQKEQKRFVVYGIVMLVFFFFFPLARIHSLEEDGGSTLYFLWNNGVFFKSFLFVLLTCVGLIGRNTSEKIKDIIVLVFGFRENPFLLNFGMLWILLAIYISIGEGVNLSQSLTTRISLTVSYYIILFLLLFGLFFTLYLTLQKAKKIKQKKYIYREDSQQQFDEKGTSTSLSNDGEDSSLHNLFKYKDEDSQV